MCTGRGHCKHLYWMLLVQSSIQQHIAQEVILRGLFIIVMLECDIEYLLVGCTVAEEEDRLRQLKLAGMQL